MTPRAHNPYDQPSPDRWGEPDGWDGDPAGREQQYGYGGYGAQPGYGGHDDAQGVRYGEPYQVPPAGYGTTYGTARAGEDAYPAPPERNSTKLAATIVAVLAVLVAGGVVTAFFVTRQEEKPSAAPTTQAPAQGGAAEGGTEATDPPAGQTATPAGQTPTPAPESSAEARFAAEGQCLVNDGTEAKPRMRIVGCGPDTYQVLARFDGTIDYTTECGRVDGYQFHYFFDSELNGLDFVLCLKRR